MLDRPECTILFGGPDVICRNEEIAVGYLVVAQLRIFSVRDIRDEEIECIRGRMIPYEPIHEVIGMPVDTLVWIFLQLDIISSLIVIAVAGVLGT